MHYRSPSLSVFMVLHWLIALWLIFPSPPSFSSLVVPWARPLQSRCADASTEGEKKQLPRMNLPSTTHQSPLPVPSAALLSQWNQSVRLVSPLHWAFRGLLAGTGRPTGDMATSQDVPLFPCLLIWKDLVEKRNGGFERERKIEREECQGFQFLFNFYVVHKNSVLCLSACLQRKGDKERKWSKHFGIKQPEC